MGGLQSIHGNFWFQFSPSEQEVTNGHNRLEYKMCPDDSTFNCIHWGDEHFFVFPKEKIHEGMTWEFEGEKYTATNQKRRPIQIVGNAYSGFFIEKIHEDGIYWFFIAENEGVLMFGSKDKSNFSSVFMLEGKCGFFASSTCQ